jgi:hypothetical protein
MPAEPHLLPILRVLGTGGTTEMAKRFHDQYLGGLRAALAGAGVAVTADDDIPATAAQILREQAAEVRRLNTLLEPKRASIKAMIDASSLGTPAAVAARASVPPEVAEAAVRRTAELTADTDLELVALLREAGDRWGHLGVALVAAGLSDPEVVVGKLTEPGREPVEEDEPSPAPLGGLHAAALVREAVASVALDRDPRAETISLAAEDEGDDIDWDDDEPAPAEPLYVDDRADPIAFTPARPAPTDGQIRVWCREHGVTVSAKGQISGRARAAYDDAHPVTS